jgi:hypothetical protein
LNPYNLQQSITCDGAVCGNGDSQITNKTKKTSIGIAGYQQDPYTVELLQAYQAMYGKNF